MSRVDLLRRVPLFHGLDSRDLERIANAFREESYGPGHKIVEIGEAGRSLFILVDGSVQVLYPARTQDFELARLEHGDFFGEMALLNNEPRSATVRAVDAVKLLVLDKAQFQSIVEASPSVALKLLEIMSVRIRNADEQISALSDEATRDQLTGLLNRPAFHQRFHEEIERSNRYGEKFSVILLDVDRLQAVNDTFGHQVGDTVLAWIGRLFNEHTRSSDSCFRTGGQEFTIITPVTDAETALCVADRLVGTVAEAKPPVEFELKITISAGYAACPEHASDEDALFRLADQALLRAKTGGGNKVCEPLPEDESPTE